MGDIAVLARRNSASAALIALALPLGGCISTQPVPAPEPPVSDPAPMPPVPPQRPSLSGAAWMLLSINGAPIAGEPAVTMLFSADGKLGGRAPCNSYFGEAAISTNEIVFSGSGATQMACEPVRMAQEGAFFRIINGIVQWWLDDSGVLTLRGPGGTLTARQQ
jgi:putative lipoprotein